MKSTSRDSTSKKSQKFRLQNTGTTVPVESLLTAHYIAKEQLITYFKFKMSVKQEHPLMIKPETKINIKKSKNDEDSERTETPDNKTEETKIVNTEIEPVVEERPIFVCKNCNLTERYDCFNDHVSFNRKVGTKVDYYLARDPFSPRSKRQFLILGSVCSMCDKDVCIKPECSIFYSKFFCSICARKYISNFPTSIQEKIKTTKRI